MIENKPFVCYFQSKQAKLSYCFVRALTATNKQWGMGFWLQTNKKNKAAVSQCTGNRETTALLVISKRVQEFTSFTTLASVYAKGEMFFSLLEGELVTNGKLEHAVLVVHILEGLGQTKVVATLNNEVAELIAQADRHRQLKGVLVNAI